MLDDTQEKKDFLEQQIEWSRKQEQILAKIESKLHEMKVIAAYALEHNLTPTEGKQLNQELEDLKAAIHLLERQLQTEVH